MPRAAAVLPPLPRCFRHRTQHVSSEPPPIFTFFCVKKGGARSKRLGSGHVFGCQNRSPGVKAGPGWHVQGMVLGLSVNTDTWGAFHPSVGAFCSGRNPPSPCSTCRGWVKRPGFAFEASLGLLKCGSCRWGRCFELVSVPFAFWRSLPLEGSPPLVPCLRARLPGLKR